MAIRNDFTAGEVLAAADLNDTLASKLDAAPEQNQQTGNYTITPSDFGSVIQYAGSATGTITIPTDATLGITSGFYQIRIINVSAYFLSIAAASGVSLFGNYSTLEFHQGGGAILTRTAPNGWNVQITPSLSYAGFRRVAAGQVAGGVISTTTTYAVTFPTGQFTSTPIITFGWYEGQNGYAWASSTTSTGFTLNAAPISGSIITRVNWIGVEQG